MSPGVAGVLPPVCVPADGGLSLLTLLLRLPLSYLSVLVKIIAITLSGKVFIEVVNKDSMIEKGEAKLTRRIEVRRCKL